MRQGSNVVEVAAAVAELLGTRLETVQEVTSILHPTFYDIYMLRFIIYI